MGKRIRGIKEKTGLEGNERGEKVIASSLRDAGMEVIDLGLRQTPEMIVNAAVQEDVDVISLSILSGAHMTIFPEVLKLMKEIKIDDVLLTGGGIIPEKDMKELYDMGVGRLFGPGTKLSEGVDYIREWVAKNRP